MGSPVVVSRTTFRYILLGLLLISAAFAAWSWLRPYAWGADSAARCQINGCEVVQDHANYWVNLKLKVDAGAEHDLQIPARLVTAGGRELEAADTTLVGDEAKAVREIWLKFWLEKADMKGPLKLRINEGELSIRKGSGEPKLRSNGRRYYVTHGW